MRIMNDTLRYGSIAILILTLSNVNGQQELVPTWEHTWAFGQEGTPLSSNPASMDNHVAIDPITGKIICTVNDGPGTFSDMGDLLYIFASDGTDLTSTPSPIGFWRSGSLYFNENTTTDITIVNDHLFAHQYVVTYPLSGSGTGNLVFGGHLDSTKWVFAHRNAAGLITGAKLIAADQSHVLYSGHGWLYCTTVDGWYAWHKYLYPTDLVLHEGIAYVRVANDILRIQISDGSELIPISGPVGDYVHLAVDQTSHLFWASQTSNGSIEVAKRALDGTVIWDNVITNSEGHHLWGLTIDASGRAWVLKSVSPWETANGPDSHLWVVNGLEAFGPYTYRERINDISSDEEHIYLTGRIDTASTATFLAAIETGLITGQEEPNPASSLSISPNPASDHMNLIGKFDRTRAAILDGQGRLLSTFQLPSSGSIPVDHLQNGVYFLKLDPYTLRFVVMH